RRRRNIVGIGILPEFISNKYARAYYRLVSTADARSAGWDDGQLYVFHHMMPDCLGGTKTVKLTEREHYHAHLLRARFAVGETKRRMEYVLDGVMRTRSG